MENSEQFLKDIAEVRRMMAESEKDDEIKEEKSPEQDHPRQEAQPAQAPIEQEEKEEAAKPAEQDAKSVSKSWQKNLLLYLHDLVYLLAVMIVVSLLFVRVVVVSGTSMYNTLVDGDYLLAISNIFYQEPKQGDIVVISKESFDNGSPIVKRVIATEGQLVDIDFKSGIVYVDGVALDEPYTYTATTTKGGVSFPLIVDEGCIFVLGDNRAVSRDSRSVEIGLVNVQEVVGKVFFLFLPGTNGTDASGNPNESRDFSRIGAVN